MASFVTVIGMIGIVVSFIHQVAEAITRLPINGLGGRWKKYETMTLVYLADAQREERSALRLLLLDLNMEVVGETDDWPTILAQAPATRLDMLLVDWGLLPVDLEVQKLVDLRFACSNAISLS